MEAYVFENYGPLIFDVTGAVITLNYAGKPVYHAGNVVTITTTDGLPNNGASSPISTPQPSMPARVSSLINFVTYQAVRDKPPTTTPKFARTPGRVNKKSSITRPMQAK